MKQLRIALFILAPIMLVLVLPTILLADSTNQIGPEDYEALILPPDASAQDGEIPSIGEGAPYQFPLVSTPADVPELDPNSTDQLSINVWYGNTQTFSQLGSPQLWANILGTVTGLDRDNPNHLLSYTINGGAEQPLNIGPDGRRLYKAGDFNIELSVGQLNKLPDVNIVVIKANNGAEVVSKTVTVKYVPSTTWPMPYTANWSSLGGDIHQGAQIVDGQWLINGNGNLTVSSAGYDRLVTLGDYFWKDYEVKVPITVKSWNVSEWGSPSNGGGVGLAVRWRGHFQTPSNEQPRLGWNRLGVRAWYRLEPKANPNEVASTLQMLGYSGKNIASRTDLQIEANKPYWFKLSVQSSPFSGQPSTYRFKVWDASKPEPSQWSLSAVGVLGEPATGSILLIAHQVIAEFGNVQVTPLPQGPFTINVLNTANGEIVLDPSKPSYNYGEKVQIRAVGAPGYKLAGWTNGLSGTQNPIIFETTQNLTVGANFSAAATPPELDVKIIGSGTVTRDAQPPYRYGQLVRLTPKANRGYVFSGWSGDLEGLDNPASIVLDTSKSVTANFVPTSTSSPQSDDFNACSLNTDLWTFIDPIGDATMLVTGTELQLSVPAGVTHDLWGVNNSVRVMQPTENKSFEIETKFDSEVNKRYQTQGIIVEQDAQNYLRFDTHFDGQGVRLFVAKIVDGVPSEIFRSNPRVNTPSYLRVTRVGNQWTYSFSDDGDTWTAVGNNFIHPLSVTHTGVFAANQAFSSDPPPAHTAIVDYFFNTDSPIVPEDGIPVNNFTIETNTIGEGTISVTPAKQTYQCFDNVILTASPAAGWSFSNWSGDLSGSSLQQQLVMEKNYKVTANFTEDPHPTVFLTYFPMATGSPQR